MEKGNAYRLMGNRIRRERKKKQLTQSQLSKISGVSRDTIAGIETGRQRAPLDPLYAIGEALEVELRDLLPSRKEVSAGLSRGVKGGDLEPDEIEIVNNIRGIT